MPRTAPAKAFVTAAEIGGGKAIIEIKNPKSTLTLELAEDSPWITLFPEGAFVTYTFDIELPRDAPQVATGPQPGDQIATIHGIRVVPDPDELAAAKAAHPSAYVDPTPDPEAIRQLHPIEGFNTVGINSNISGESVRGLLGIPERPAGDAPKVATIVRSSNDA